MSIMQLPDLSEMSLPLSVSLQTGMEMQAEAEGKEPVGGSSKPMSYAEIQRTSSDLSEQNHALAYAYMCVEDADLERLDSEETKYKRQLDDMQYAFEGVGLEEDRAFYAKMLQKPQAFPFWVRYAWLFCRLMQNPTSNTYKDRDGFPVTLINLTWHPGTSGMTTETINGIRAARAVNFRQVVEYIGRKGFALPVANSAGEVHDKVIQSKKKAAKRQRRQEQQQQQQQP